ncbi:MAG: hypothetical protein HQL31_13435 [Planctomycetes bacterium]|nr:hypothetical protein [Planctomycetota bacterium]
MLENDLALLSEKPLAMREGPAGIWDSRYRLHVERTGERLQRQMEGAERLFIEAELHALEVAGDPGRIRSGQSWAGFIFRMLRGDMAGIGEIHPPASGGEVEVPPFIKFLMEELDRAKKVSQLKNYKGITREHLKSMGDFLRY